MRQLFFKAVLSVVILTGCSHHPSGIYECVLINNKVTSATSVNDSLYKTEDEYWKDCPITGYNFKGRNEVSINLRGVNLPASYFIENGEIRINAIGTTLVLKEKDDSTLLSVGPVPGSFRKINWGPLPATPMSAGMYIGLVIFCLLFLAIAFTWVRKRTLWLKQRRSALRRQQLLERIREKEEAGWLV